MTIECPERLNNGARCPVTHVYCQKKTTRMMHSQARNNSLMPINSSRDMVPQKLIPHKATDSSSDSTIVEGATPTTTTTHTNNNMTREQENNDHDLTMTWIDDYFDKDDDKTLAVFDFANTSNFPFGNNGEPWLSFFLIYIETTLYTIFFLRYYPTAGVLFWVVTFIAAAIFGRVLKTGYQTATTFTSRHAALTMNGGFRYVEIINNTITDYTIPLTLIQDIHIWPAMYGKGRATIHFKQPVTFDVGPMRGVPLQEFLVQPLKDPNPVLFKRVVLGVKEEFEKYLPRDKQKES